MPPWLTTVADQVWTGFLDLLPTIITVWAGFKLITHRQEVERRDRIADDRDARIRGLIADVLRLADPAAKPSSAQRVDAKVGELLLFLNPSVYVESKLQDRAEELRSAQEGVILAQETLDLTTMRRSEAANVVPDIDTWFHFASKLRDATAELREAHRKFTTSALAWSQTAYGMVPKSTSPWGRGFRKVTRTCRLLLTKGRAAFGRITSGAPPME